MPGRICRSCHAMVGVTNATYDGIADCPSCKGAKSILPCEECKGSGKITLFLCNTCWLEGVGSGDELRVPVPRDLRMSLADTVAFCPKREASCFVRTCIDDYMNANAFANRKTPCYRCNIGKEVRDDFASQP